MCPTLGKSRSRRKSHAFVCSEDASKYHADLEASLASLAGVNTSCRGCEAVGHDGLLTVSPTPAACDDKVHGHQLHIRQCSPLTNQGGLPYYEGMGVQWLRWEQ